MQSKILAHVEHQVFGQRENCAQCVQGAFDGRCTNTSWPTEHLSSAANKTETLALEKQGNIYEQEQKKRYQIRQKLVE